VPAIEMAGPLDLLQLITNATNATSHVLIKIFIEVKYFEFEVKIAF
jgi:hypothetical protein